MKHTWKVSLMLLAIFIAAQIAGLTIIIMYIDANATLKNGKTSFSELPFNIERPRVEESVSYIYIMLAVIIGTLFLLLLIKFRKIGLWKIWFLIAVATTLTVALSAFMPQGVSLVLAAGLALWKVYRPNIYIHNLTEMMIYGGLAAIFTPIINIFSGFMLLVFISVYDMYAVWKSKHMVKMAKFQTESRLFAGLYIPYESRQEKEKSRKIREGYQPSVHEDEKTIIKKEKTAVLGGGDIGFPLIFAGVVMKTLINSGSPIAAAFAQTMIVVAFSGTALFLLLLKSEKEKFYPAMPFLSIGCFLGYGLIYLFTLF